MPSAAVVFHGRVQGVGFRYTTCATAERFDVRGWVRNEPDGTVRCEVEGDAAEIDRFLEAVEDAMSGHVDQRVYVAPGVDQMPDQGVVVRR